MIRIYVFIDGQTGNNTNTAAQSAWWDLRDHPEAENIYIVDAADSQNSAFIQQFKVYRFPTVVFVAMTDESTGKTITRIEGAAGQDQIRAVFEEVLNGKYGYGEGSGNTPAIIPGDDADQSFGFGLGLGGDLGKWLMWALVGYTAYQVSKNKK